MSAVVAVTGALRRAARYRLLSRAFAYPSAARLESVATAAWEAAVTAPVELRPALRRLADAAGGADEATLAGEHVELFQRQVRCPPYEGAWGPAQLAGKAALLADVAGFYRAFGLEPGEGQPEVEDHLCAELEFMSALAFKEAWALAENSGEGLQVTRDAARAFLREHLGRWAPAFAARVAETAAGTFYPAAAAALAAWLQDECARLGVNPDRVDGPQAAEDGSFSCPMVGPAGASS